MGNVFVSVWATGIDEEGGVAGNGVPEGPAVEPEFPLEKIANAIPMTAKTAMITTNIVGFFMVPILSHFPVGCHPRGRVESAFQRLRGDEVNEYDPEYPQKDRGRKRNE